jgi:hypothetical protein
LREVRRGIFMEKRYEDIYSHPIGKGYEGIYEGLLPRLAECNLAESTLRLGGEVVEREVRISFLGRGYIITNEGVRPEDGLPVNVNYLNALIYYITSDGEGDLSGDFAPLVRITGLLDGLNRAKDSASDSSLIREFGDSPERLRAAVTRLGGEEQRTGDALKHVWRLPALPKIVVQITLYEADEEFPADIQVMLDRASSKFLAHECLSAIIDLLSQSLIEVATE